MKLVLPMNYEYLEQDEMMYLDGGWWSEKKRYGAANYMSQRESKELQYNLDLAELTGNFSVGLLATFVSELLPLGEYLCYMLVCCLVDLVSIQPHAESYYI